MIPRLTLMGGRGACLSLLGVTRELGGTLLAEGYHAPARISRGRRFTDLDTGLTYRAPVGLKRGVWAVGAGLETYLMEAPLEFKPDVVTPRSAG